MSLRAKRAKNKGSFNRHSHNDDVDKVENDPHDQPQIIVPNSTTIQKPHTEEIQIPSVVTPHDLYYQYTPSANTIRTMMELLRGDKNLEFFKFNSELGITRNDLQQSKRGGSESEQQRQRFIQAALEAAGLSGGLHGMVQHAAAQEYARKLIKADEIDPYLQELKLMIDLLVRYGTVAGISRFQFLTQIPGFSTQLALPTGLSPADYNMANPLQPFPKSPEDKKAKAQEDLHTRYQQELLRATHPVIWQMYLKECKAEVGNGKDINELPEPLRRKIFSDVVLKSVVIHLLSRIYKLTSVSSPDGSPLDLIGNNIAQEISTRDIQRGAEMGMDTYHTRMAQLAYNVDKDPGAISLRLQLEPILALGQKSPVDRAGMYAYLKREADKVQVFYSQAAVTSGTVARNEVQASFKTGVMQSMKAKLRNWADRLKESINGWDEGKQGSKHKPVKDGFVLPFLNIGGEVIDESTHAGKRQANSRRNLQAWINGLTVAGGTVAAWALAPEWAPHISRAIVAPVPGLGEIGINGWLFGGNPFNGVISENAGISTFVNGWVAYYGTQLRQIYWKSLDFNPKCLPIVSWFYDQNEQTPGSVDLSIRRKGFELLLTFASGVSSLSGLQVWLTQILAQHPEILNTATYSFGLFVFLSTFAGREIIMQMLIDREKPENKEVNKAQERSRPFTIRSALQKVGADKLGEDMADFISFVISGSVATVGGAFSVEAAISLAEKLEPHAEWMNTAALIGLESWILVCVLYIFYSKGYFEAFTKRGFSKGAMVLVILGFTQSATFDTLFAMSMNPFNKQGTLAKKSGFATELYIDHTIPTLELVSKHIPLEQPKLKTVGVESPENTYLEDMVYDFESDARLFAKAAVGSSSGNVQKIFEQQEKMRPIREQMRAIEHLIKDKEQELAEEDIHETQQQALEAEINQLKQELEQKQRQMQPYVTEISRLRGLLDPRSYNGPVSKSIHDAIHGSQGYNPFPETDTEASSITSARSQVELLWQQWVLSGKLDPPRVIAEKIGDNTVFLDGERGEVPSLLAVIQSLESVFVDSATDASLDHLDSWENFEGSWVVIYDHIWRQINGRGGYVETLNDIGQNANILGDEVEKYIKKWKQFLGSLSAVGSVYAGVDGGYGDLQANFDFDIPTQGKIGIPKDKLNLVIKPIELFRGDQGQLMFYFIFLLALSWARFSDNVQIGQRAIKMAREAYRRTVERLGNESTFAAELNVKASTAETAAGIYPKTVRDINSITEGNPDIAFAQDFMTNVAGLTATNFNEFQAAMKSMRASLDTNQTMQFMMYFLSEMLALNKVTLGAELADLHERVSQDIAVINDHDLLDSLARRVMGDPFLMGEHKVGGATIQLEKHQILSAKGKIHYIPQESDLERAVTSCLHTHHNGAIPVCLLPHPYLLSGKDTDRDPTALKRNGAKGIKLVAQVNKYLDSKPNVFEVLNGISFALLGDETLDTICQSTLRMHYKDFKEGKRPEATIHYRDPLNKIVYCLLENRQTHFSYAELAVIADIEVPTKEKNKMQTVIKKVDEVLEILFAMNGVYKDDIQLKGVHCKKEYLAQNNT